MRNRLILPFIILPSFLFNLHSNASLPLGEVGGSTPIYLDQTKYIEARVEDALSRMTLAEKIDVIHAQSKFSSAGVKRLGFPDFWTDDGPHGVRPDVLWDEWEQAGQTNDSCVAFPALTCLAATSFTFALVRCSLGRRSALSRQSHDSGTWREHLPHTAGWPQLRIHG